MVNLFRYIKDVIKRKGDLKMDTTKEELDYYYDEVLCNYDDEDKDEVNDYYDL